MSTVHALLARFFALLLDPFARFTPLVGLVLISAVSGVLLAVGFRFSSRPEAIRAAKSQVQAHLLAVRLYRDDLTVVFRSQLSLLRSLGVYMRNMLLPFAAMLLPFGLLFAHLDARYGARALQPGERAIVKAIVNPATLNDWRLEGSDGIDVDSVPVRIPARGEIVWRVRAATAGHHHIALVDGSRRVEKDAYIATEDRGAAPRRASAGLLALFVAPTEPTIGGTGVESIAIDYPPLPLTVLGWHLHWVVVFLIASSAAALLVRKRVGAEF
jgi:hypothetical protein